MALTTALADDAAIFEYSYTRGNSGVYHLAGAWGGFFRFSAEFANGAVIPIRVTDGSSNTEISTATFNLSANTLTVVGVIASTNGGALVNWSGRTRLLVHALLRGLPLCATPATNGQVLAWDAATSEWCPETLPTGLPLCATPPTAGQILVWDATNNWYCPADFCVLVTACLTPPYAPPAIEQGTLEGPTTTDVQSTGTTPTDSHTLLIAFWYQMLEYPGGGAQSMNFLSSLGGIAMQLSESNPASNFTSVDASNASVLNQNNMGGDVAFGAIARTVGDGNWHSFALSINTTTQVLQMMIDLTFYDLSADANTVWFSTNAISYGGVFIFDFDGSNALSDFLLQTNAPFFDLSVGANQNKLFAAGNHPVNWGANGSGPTGIRPQIFMHGDHTSWNNNLGSGGSFIVQGTALTDFTPGPT